MRPDKKRAGPPPKGPARHQPRHQHAAEATSRVTDEADILPLAAYRCWSHHWCGCLHADDCWLTRPLPVHDHDRLCSGYLGDGGQWFPHCAPTGTGAA